MSQFPSNPSPSLNSGPGSESESEFSNPAIWPKAFAWAIGVILVGLVIWRANLIPSWPNAADRDRERKLELNQEAQKRLGQENAHKVEEAMNRIANDPSAKKETLNLTPSNSNEKPSQP